MGVELVGLTFKFKVVGYGMVRVCPSCIMKNFKIGMHDSYCVNLIKLNPRISLSFKLKYS